MSFSLYDVPTCSVNLSEASALESYLFSKGLAVLKYFFFCILNFICCYLLLASEISLTNTASENLTWNLSSVAPAYVKVCTLGYCNII